MVGNLATQAVKKKDLAEARSTWKEYQLKRFFKVTRTSIGTLVEMLDPPVPLQMMLDLERQWVETFMMLRGWRQLPGVVSMMGLDEWV